MAPKDLDIMHLKELSIKELIEIRSHYENNVSLIQDIINAKLKDMLHDKSSPPGKDN